jgi:hypothetical protein
MQTVTLCFDASQCDAPYTDMFMANGGAINAAAARWSTDFSVSGSEKSSSLRLGSNILARVSIDLPAHVAQVDENGHVLIDANVRLNVATTRVEAGINATLVKSFAGDGSDTLSSVLKLTNKNGHAQIGLTYKNWLAHSATVGISNVNVNVNGVPAHVVQWRRDAKREQVEAEAVACIENYATSGWDTRQKIVYRPASTLHKTVYRDSVGVAQQGYAFLHDAVERGIPYSNTALNSLLKSAIAVEKGQGEAAIVSFLEDTKVPSLKAAGQAKAVAAALSVLSGFEIIYTPDGRQSIGTNGPEFVAAECWPRRLHEPGSGGDCDDSSLLAISITNYCIDNGAGTIGDEFEYIRAVHNAVGPYYTPAVCVVGAASPEASNATTKHGGDGSVAGHAIGVYLNKLAVVGSLHQSEHAHNGSVAKENVDNARFDALFPAALIATLPQDEQEVLSSYQCAVRDMERDGNLSLLRLSPYAIEGTTIASSVIYETDYEKRKLRERDVKRDKLAFAKIGATCARSAKVMHVGNTDHDNSHVFYKDFVELTFPRSHPLYKNEKLRSMGCAASQYVIHRGSDAGCPPRQFVENDFALTPLVCVGADVGGVMDAASEYAARELIPPSYKGAMQLDTFQANNIAESVSKLKELKTYVESSLFDDNSHVTEHVVSFSTLLYNPSSINQLCEKIKSVAASGCVDIMPLQEYAKAPNGDDVGVMVAISVATSI